jgi:gliding motility-associated protein GldC
MSDKIESEIRFKVGLDENKVPDKISWMAEDAGMKGFDEAKAIMLSVYDKKSGETLRVDLWTKDMKVDEMKQFFHQTLVSMADTLQRATNEDDLANDMREYCRKLAKKL